MKNDLRTMEKIQGQKEKDILKRETQPLDPEGRAMAEHKRFTFDVIAVPTDPLR